jgi:hypothetical protein
MHGYKLDGKPLIVKIAGQRDPPRHRSGLGYDRDRDRDHREDHREEHRGHHGHHGHYGQPPPPGGGPPPGEPDDQLALDAVSSRFRCVLCAVCLPAMSAPHCRSCSRLETAGGVHVVDWWCFRQLECCADLVRNCAVAGYAAPAWGPHPPGPYPGAPYQQGPPYGDPHYGEHVSAVAPYVGSLAWA